MPKSSAVLTRPVPKTCCQRRLTATRAVSGCSGATSHCARPRRLRGASVGSGGRNAGVSAADLVAALVVLAALQDVRRPRRRPLLEDQRRRHLLLESAALLLERRPAARAAGRTIGRVLAVDVLDEVVAQQLALLLAVALAACGTFERVLRPASAGRQAVACPAAWPSARRPATRADRASRRPSTGLARTSPAAQPASAIILRFTSAISALAIAGHAFGRLQLRSPPARRT